MRWTLHNSGLRSLGRMTIIFFPQMQYLLTQMSLENKSRTPATTKSAFASALPNSKMDRPSLRLASTKNATSTLASALRAVSVNVKRRSTPSQRRSDTSTRREQRPSSNTSPLRLQAKSRSSSKSALTALPPPTWLSTPTDTSAASAERPSSVWPLMARDSLSPSKTKRSKSLSLPLPVKERPPPRKRSEQLPLARIEGCII